MRQQNGFEKVKKDRTVDLSSGEKVPMTLWPEEATYTMIGIASAGVASPTVSCVSGRQSGGSSKDSAVSADAGGPISCKCGRRRPAGAGAGDTNLVAQHSALDVMLSVGPRST